MLISELLPALDSLKAELQAEEVWFHANINCNQKFGLAIRLVTLPQMPGEPYGQGITISPSGSTWEELVEKARELAPPAFARGFEKMREHMAHAIIKLSDSNGIVDHATLRQEAHCSQRIIDLFGADAIATANALAAKGPFTLVSTPNKDNGAPQGEEKTDEEVIEAVAGDPSDAH